MKPMSEEAKLIRRDALAKRKTNKELLRAVAMDIGKEVAHHIEIMFPEAVKAAPSTFLLSVRNCTHNNIIAWVESNADPEKRLAFNDAFRRHLRAQYKKIRKEAQ